MGHWACGCLWGKGQIKEMCLLRCFFKVTTEMAEWTDRGRLFQRHGISWDVSWLLIRYRVNSATPNLANLIANAWVDNQHKVEPSINLTSRNSHYIGNANLYSRNVQHCMCEFNELNWILRNEHIDWLIGFQREYSHGTFSCSSSCWIWVIARMVAPLSVCSRGRTDKLSLSAASVREWVCGCSSLSWPALLFSHIFKYGLQ